MYGVTSEGLLGGGAVFRVDLSVTSMSLDEPRASQSLAPTIFVRGWAFDEAADTGAGVDAVHVYGIPGSGTPVFLGSATLIDRPDVAAVYGSRYLHSGFDLSVTDLSPGSWTVVAYAHSTATGAFEISRSVTFTVADGATRPVMTIDAPTATVGPHFTVRGWALDQGAGATVGVDAIHTYAVPASGGAAVFLGATAPGVSRWDVAAVYGARFINSGYTLDVSGLTPGDYTLVVYARSSQSGQWLWQTRAISVTDHGLPAMSLDSPRDGTTATQSFHLDGWAADLSPRAAQASTCCMCGRSPQTAAPRRSSAWRRPASCAATSAPHSDRSSRRRGSSSRSTGSRPARINSSSTRTRRSRTRSVSGAWLR